MSTKRPTLNTYSRIRQALHWIGALLILVMIPMGLVMARTDSDALRAALYRGHAFIGLLVLAVAVVRIGFASRFPVAPPAGLTKANEVLFKAVHWAALIVPVFLAMSGLGALAMNDLMPIALQPGSAIPAELADARAQSGHRLMAWTYIAILVIHIAGVMRYQFTKGNVLGRMGVGLPGSKAT